MKTNRIILAALFISAAVSCQKESFGGLENARETEAATFVAGEMTKTSLNGNNIYWTSDDVIAVYDNYGCRNEFIVQDVDASYAKFAGEVTRGTTKIYAVYPSQLAGDISGSTINVTIPVDQTPKVGSFAEEHNISVAKSEKTPGVAAIDNITFKNVGSFLKFTIPSYIEDVKSVTFSTSRAIAGPATVDASADVPVAVVAKDGSKSVTMTGSYPAGSQFVFVLSSGEIQGFTVTVVADKATWNITKNTTVTFAPGQYKNLGTLELEQVSASAVHTYPEDILTGTTVNVALNVPTATLQYASDLKIEVRNEDGTLVRSASSSTLSSSVTLAATQDWPYLPQGKYTVSGSYKLRDVVKNFSTTFTSPAPTFEVTSNAYTSYTKYEANLIDEANSCDAETIYGVNKASVTIDPNLIEKYSSPLDGFTYKVDNGEDTTDDNVTVQSWGKHVVTATYTFDGVTISGSTDCHITGLPYTANPPKKTGNYSWADNSKVNFTGETGTNNIDWNSDGVHLEGTSKVARITSPEFHVPDEFGVSLTVPVKFYSVCAMWTHAQPQLKCRISGAEKINRTGAKASNSFSSNKTENFTGEATGVLKTSNKTIEIENAYAKSTAYVYVYSVTLNYN